MGNPSISLPASQETAQGKKMSLGVLENDLQTLLYSRPGGTFVTGHLTIFDSE